MDVNSWGLHRPTELNLTWPRTGQNAVKAVWNNNNARHLEYFDNYFLVVCDVDGFKHFAVLSSAEFPHQLVIILIPVDKTDSGY